jgi:trehalose-phosphatase
MDGVVTRTATLHERAWKETFDSFLKAHARVAEQEQGEFTSADYRQFVDGKPRYDGVADFLAARGIELERGDPADSPDKETVCGVGNRKNRRFLELLDAEGAEVFGDTISALARWRRGGLKLAIISASRNCRRVLRASQLEDVVDEIVGGEVAAELGLPDKAATMREAARRLGVAPGDAVVLEDATAGVKAARAAGFGLIVGVDRGGQTEQLRSAGAHEVTTDVFKLRFPRRLPRVFDRLDELANRMEGRALVLFLDFDGTLSPIVDDPADAKLATGMSEAITALAQRGPVAMVSGRDREDVKGRVGLDDLIYAGSHGLDIAGDGHRHVHPEAKGAIEDVDRAEHVLRERIGEIPGVVIERKRFSVAAHYRMIKEEGEVERVRRTVDEVQSTTRLRKRTGKMVIELEPEVEWHKGRAVAWLMEVLGVDPERAFPMFIGDDETDEDAFGALGSTGAGVRVTEEVSDSLADYRVAGPDEVREFLTWLAGHK